MNSTVTAVLNAYKNKCLLYGFLYYFYTFCIMYRYDACYVDI